jgi:uncharacterized membrane protein
VLLSTGADEQIVLFTYLAVLNGGMLALARLRSWRILSLVAFCGTTLYYWGWADAFYTTEKLARTAFFATLFFVEFAAVPVVETRREDKLYLLQVILVLINATNFLVALHVLLFEDHRWAMTAAVVALGAAHLGVVGALPSTEGRRPSPARLLFAGLALMFVTLAIPIRLEGKWITIAWATEGAILVWSGFRVRLGWLRWAGLLLLSLAVLRLFLFEVDVERFVLNPRFITLAIIVACSALSFWFSRRNATLLTDVERRAFGLVGLAIHPLTVWTLSLEVWDLFGRMRAQADVGIDAGLAQQLALSLLWTVYATALTVVGVRRSASPLRWQGLALLALVAGKVFLYDMASLERVYRIASFVVLGVLALVVSFLYQRRSAIGGPEEKK